MMPNEDSADHEFVFLVHKSTSTTSSITSQSSSSSSSSFGVPKFPHLRPIPIELENPALRAEFHHAKSPPPRSPPPTATCSSRMSPLPMELLELMPPRLRMQGYISGNPPSSDEPPPPTRPPPPTNYSPADYCYFGVDSKGNTPTAPLDPHDAFGNQQHNYDYLRELVTSDAVAVLANNSSPITSLVRTAAKTRAISPNQRGVEPQPPSDRSAAKLLKPDIITSNVIAGSNVQSQQLPAPKFTRANDMKLISSGPFVSQETKSQNQPVVMTSSNKCATRDVCSAVAPAPYKAVLTNDGGQNQVLKKLNQPTPFLTSFRSAAGPVANTQCHPKIPDSDVNKVNNYQRKPSEVSQNSAKFPTPFATERYTPANSNISPILKRAPVLNTKLGSPPRYDAGLPSFETNQSAVVDQSNYVVNRSQYRRYFPASSDKYNSSDSETGFRKEQSTFSDKSVPLVPPRRGIDDASSDSTSFSSSSYRSSTSDHTAGIFARPTHGISKISYPLSDKYTNVLNANMSSSKKEQKTVSPALDKLEHLQELLSSPVPHRATLRTEGSFPVHPSQKRDGQLNSNYFSPNSSHSNSPHSSPSFQRLAQQNSFSRSQEKIFPPSYPQAGCLPVPNSSAPPSDSFRGNSNLNSPVFSRLPYRGQHCLIQPLPAPPPTIPWSKNPSSSSDPNVNAYEPDSIYDNIVSAKMSPSISKINTLSGHSSAPNSPLTRHTNKESHVQPLSPHLYRDRPRSPEPVKFPSYPKNSAIDSNATHHFYRNRPLPPEPVMSSSQSFEDPRCYPSYVSSSQHHHPRYWINDQCPTCRQPQLHQHVHDGSLFRSSSCERFGQMSSPTSSPHTQRGGSASPSLRHSPSPDPGLGKPPRPRRQQYRRGVGMGTLSSSQPQLNQHPVFCSSPVCTVPHIHHAPATTITAVVAPQCYTHYDSSGCLSHAHVPLQTQPKPYCPSDGEFNGHHSATCDSSALCASEDCADKLKGNPSHKSLYKSMRNLLMSNQ